MKQLDTRRQLMCIGHSHVACVAQAAGKLQVPMQAMNFWDMPGAVLREDGVPRLSTDIELRLRRHPGPLFSLMGGAAHGVLGMLVHPRRFDFVLPAQPDLPLGPAAEILPLRAVQGMLESLMADYLVLMKQLRQCCTGALFHVEPPPPYADAGRMHADIPWPLYPGMCHEISPAPFRLKLWRLHTEILDDWCRANGAELLRCPVETMDPDGFMLDAFYGDGAHANVAYGELVLQQMKGLA
ncbi:MAG: hypothetical protein ACYC0F_12765 [Rhodanobacter sp.]